MHPCVRPSILQGGFTYVTIIMGVVLFVTSLIMIALRFWVLRTGGFPEGRAASFATSEFQPKPPALSSDADSRNDVFKVLDKPDTLKARPAGAHKVSGL